MKRTLAVVALMLFCAMALSGCTMIKGLERDVRVVLEVDGSIVGGEMVNIFNNAVIAEPDAPGGKLFLGWTTQEAWNEADAETVPLIANKGLVRFDDIQSVLRNDVHSVVLRAVFVPAPQRDLVIAWYNKEGTSGLNQEYMDSFRTRLDEFLRHEGYQPENMDILIRGYEGGVGDTCAAITKDADVDITVGWSNTDNLTGTGGWKEGVDFIENVGGITIGAKERFTARLTDTELSLKVYAWIQDTYGSTVAKAD